ncbi:MAG: alkaline phosphatase family protein [Bacteroidetes bacterium]|nr:alkaline phosphatase family protein [Bacteroidota bacterium]MBS1739073.1 alkaline phosphatase family protein [Bacteroidota bacterium]
MFKLTKLLSALAIILSLLSIAKAQPIERPKLVVGIVIDQMRWDYLYRFYDRFGNDGFKRLLNGGFSCAQTKINYLPAYTAPGHSCIYTGSVPSIHGIAGNDWIDIQSGKSVYCTEDNSVLPVGGSVSAGKMSPRNLLTTTITDELRLATNFQSRVFGISLKDRGAIIPAGHLANGAFWYDDSMGSFISSTYYGKSLPTWLSNFNNQHLPDSFLKQKWQLLFPENSYKQSLNDDNPYKGKIPGEKDSRFPHLQTQHLKYSTLRFTPWGNSYTIAASKACIEGEKLGLSVNQTDFLCISFSSTDYIGHTFSPNSMEVEDTYLRLDRDLADFFTYLDKKIGKGKYLLFLTADHGAAHNARFLIDNHVPAGNENEYQVGQHLRQFLKQETGYDSLVRGVENYQVIFNDDKIKQAGLTLKAIKSKVKNWFLQQPQVAYVVDMDNIAATPLPGNLSAMIANGYNRLRSGSMLIIYNPGWYHGYSPTGTTHGTWHPYDTHIPLIWYGWKIKNGESQTPAMMEDIAATLAALLHIQMPNGCIGKPISELFK